MKLVLRLPSPPRLVLSVCRRRRSVKILPRPLAIGYVLSSYFSLTRDTTAAFFSPRKRSRETITNNPTERSPCHRQTHYPESSSNRLCCPLCILPRHQGAQGAPKGPQEGEAHQTHQVDSAGRSYCHRPHHEVQIACS